MLEGTDCLIQHPLVRAPGRVPDLLQQLHPVVVELQQLPIVGWCPAKVPELMHKVIDLVSILGDGSPEHLPEQSAYIAPFTTPHGVVDTIHSILDCVVGCPNRVSHSTLHVDPGDPGVPQQLVSCCLQPLHIPELLPHLPEPSLSHLDCRQEAIFLLQSLHLASSRPPRGLDEGSLPFQQH